MPKVKTEHFVPKFYLKNFTLKEDKIFVFDKRTQISFNTNINNIAGEQYFYDLIQEYEPDKTQMIEHFFSALESDLKHSLDNTLQSISGKRRITLRQKDEMSFFIAIQLMRTREQREYIKDHFGKFFKALFRETHNLSDIEKVALDQLEIDPDFAKILHTQLLFDADIINSTISTLNKHIWLIGINNTTLPLYTSDHPVVKKAHKKDRLHSNLGLESEGIEIAFPLTPKYILIIKEGQYFKALKNRNYKSILLKREDVSYYNELQIFQSDRQIYCPSASFEQIIEICKNNPQSFTDKKRRIETNKYIGTRGTLIQFKDRIE